MLETASRQVYVPDRRIGNSYLPRPKWWVYAVVYGLEGMVVASIVLAFATSGGRPSGSPLGVRFLELALAGMVGIAAAWLVWWYATFGKSRPAT